MITIQQVLRPTVFLANQNTNVSVFPVGDVSTAACIDDVTPDEDATYIKHNVTAPGGPPLIKMAFRVDAPPIRVGSISNVRVTTRHRGTASGVPQVNNIDSQVRLGTTFYTGTPDPLSNSSSSISYEERPNDYAVNPATGLAWSWADIDVLGVGYTGNPQFFPDVWRVTQVWALVTAQVDAAIAVDSLVMKVGESETEIAKIVSATGAILKTSASDSEVGGAA